MGNPMGLGCCWSLVSIGTGKNYHCKGPAVSHVSHSPVDMYEEGLGETVEVHAAVHGGLSDQATDTCQMQAAVT